jgi:ubiquinone/menaquinone biosynthesis C-methylase UbiE
MSTRHPKGYWYPPGLLYDLVFKRMLRGLRRRVSRIIEKEKLYPWLDICCGTGDQLRGHVPDKRAQRVDAGCDRAGYGLDLGFGFVRYAKARTPEVPFVCGDAARLPFMDRSLRAVSVSFGLHDKSPELRRVIVTEAKRVLKPEGRLIAVDFENPWDTGSKLGALFTRAVERFARGDHYRNGREFLRRGGLRAFLGESGFAEVSRRDVPVGSIGVVVARVDSDTS